MWCWLIRRDLTAAADGELSPGRSARVRAHLSACTGCARLYADIENALPAHRRLLAHIAGPADVRTEQLLARLHGELRQEAEPERRAFRLWPPLAAATAAGALVLFLLRDQAPQLSRVAEVREPVAPLGETAKQGRVVKAPARKVEESVERAKPAAPALASEDSALAGAELPAEVIENPELFRDYKFFERLEALEHFETVRNLPLDDTEGGHSG